MASLAVNKRIEPFGETDVHEGVKLVLCRPRVAGHEVFQFSGVEDIGGGICKGSEEIVEGCGCGGNALGFGGEFGSEFFSGSSDIGCRVLSNLRPVSNTVAVPFELFAEGAARLGRPVFGSKLTGACVDPLYFVGLGAHACGQFGAFGTGEGGGSEERCGKRTPGR